jgi:hypothetical protein
MQDAWRAQVSGFRDAVESRLKGGLQPVKDMMGTTELADDPPAHTPEQPASQS